jgi:hypothetical protein
VFDCGRSWRSPVASTAAKASSFRAHAFREEFDLEKLNLDPDEVSRGVRDRSPGRKVRI